MINQITQYAEGRQTIMEDEPHHESKHHENNFKTQQKSLQIQDNSKFRRNIKMDPSTL